MKKNDFLKTWFLAIAVLVTGVSLTSGQAEEASKEVTITEKIREDGTKIETIYLSKLPPEQYYGSYLGGVSRRRHYDDLIAPLIKVSLGDKIIIKIHPLCLDDYDSYFYFDTKKNDLSILSPERSSSHFLESSWAKEPCDAHDWERYYRSWEAIATGAVVLTFEGEDAAAAIRVPSGKIKLKVPVIVEE